jgi:hypothetical protein
MKTKSILIVILSIIIGFVIGFFTNGLITKSKIEKFIKIGTHQGFKGKYYQIINPTEEQEENINPILDKYGQVFHQNMINMRIRMKELHDSMVMDLKPYLADDQFNRLKETINRFGKNKDFGPGRHHPRPPQNDCEPGTKKKRHQIN